jgi:hypothetical protein
MRTLFAIGLSLVTVDAFTPPRPFRCYQRQSVVSCAEKKDDDNDASGLGSRWLKRVSKGLASLSLKDAAWRKSITSAQDEAGLEISLFEGNPAGPASQALKVLEGLVEAETSRAQQIVESGGAVVRPKDVSSNPGPLGRAEASVVLALENLVAAEQDRARRGSLLRDAMANNEDNTDDNNDDINDDKDKTKNKKKVVAIVRPKDASRPQLLGLLGELEKETTAALEKISLSERKRVGSGGGAFKAPADLPLEERSVLGDAEDAARRLVASEVARLEMMVASGSLFVRPMDVVVKGDQEEGEEEEEEASSPSSPLSFTSTYEASTPASNSFPSSSTSSSSSSSSSTSSSSSPLAEAERAVVDFSATVRAYELARLEQLRAKGLLPERPMEAAPNSAAGITERFGVGMLRGPYMFAKVVARTLELLLGAAEEAAQSEHDAREALETNKEAAEANRKLLVQLKEGVDRAPVLTGALMARTKELLETADGAANKKGGLL